MEIFKQLNKLGYKHYVDLTIEELDKLPIDSIERRIECSLIIDWFREIHCVFIKIEVGDFFDTYAKSYSYQATCKVFKNRELDGTAVVRNEQNNHIFYSYYEAREQAILKAIELCQKEK